MIYINGRFLTRSMTGVERYAYMICKAMAKLGQDFIMVCPEAPLQPCYDISDLQIVRFGKGNSHFWEQFILPFFFIGKRDYLLFNFTGLGTILIRNKIMTIHDLSFLENPKWFSRPYYLWYKLMTPLAVRTSKHIITVSQFSKNEILRFYPFIKAKDITVAYCDADEEKFHRMQEQVPTAKKYVLAVSSLDPRKNFDRLIKAFEGLPEYNLYIVGKYNRVFTGKDLTSNENKNIRFLGRVSDEELLQLYNQASCFIFPSIYEGFGIPPIEAMHCGCPVLAADIPVTREVCGDAALYFNPYDVDSIRDTVQNYFHNIETYKAILQEKGNGNIKCFSWKHSAAVILEIARRLTTE